MIVVDGRGGGGVRFCCRFGICDAARDHVLDGFVCEAFFVSK